MPGSGGRDDEHSHPARVAVRVAMPSRELEHCVDEAIGDGLPRSNHEASLLVMQLLVGWVSDSSAILATLSPA
jgi:hypothetical protein